MSGINIAEQCHVVNATPPIDINAAAQTSDYWSMEKYSHASIICTFGVTGAASAITVEESDNLSGSNTTAITFDFYAEETAAGDTLTKGTSAASITTSTEDSITYVIEIESAQLTDGYPCLCVKAADPSAATLYSCVAILSGARYADATTPTAIA